MKKEVRKKVAANKQQLFKTGGGTPQITPLTTVEETIYNLILVSVEGLSPRYDDDNNPIELHHETIEQTIVNSLKEGCNEIEQEEDEEEVIYLQCDQEEVKVPASTSDIGKCFETPDKENSVINRPQRWNSKSLKRPLSKELQVTRQNNIKTKLQAAQKVSILSESKKVVLELQATYLKKEITFQEKEMELKLKKAEEDIKNAQLDGEIKQIEKRIKDETLKKIMNSSSFNI